MVTRMKSFAVALPIAIALGAFTAEAQLNPFGQSNIIVPQSDRELMHDAARPLYTAAEPKIGATASWNDPKSGDFGTVQLTEVYDWRGMSCRKLHHIVKLKGIRDTISLAIDRCKTEAGEWKVRY